MALGAWAETIAKDGRGSSESSVFDSRPRLSARIVLRSCRWSLKAAATDNDGGHGHEWGSLAGHGGGGS